MSDIKHSCQQQPQDRVRNKESSKLNNMSLCIVIIPIMFANLQPREIKMSNGGLASVLTTKRVRVCSESFRAKVCTITRWKYVFINSFSRIVFKDIAGHNVFWNMIKFGELKLRKIQLNRRQYQCYRMNVPNINEVYNV